MSYSIEEEVLVLAVINCSGGSSRGSCSSGGDSIYVNFTHR